MLREEHGAGRQGAGWGAGILSCHNLGFRAQDLDAPSMVDDTISNGDVGDEVQGPFEQALAAYQKGGSAEELLPTFLEIVRSSPNHGAAWTCLCWLQLLASRPLTALKSGRMAVRLSPRDPQARLNLSLAMLETNTKGVREQIQQIRNVLTMAPDLKEELQQSMVDGLERRGDWQALRKVKTWLFP